MTINHNYYLQQPPKNRQSNLPMRFVTANCKPACQEQIHQPSHSADNGDSTTQSGASLRTSVFCVFFVKSNLLQSRAHSKKCSAVVQHVEMQIELSLQSGAHFAHSFRRSRHETAETETLLGRPMAPHYPEITQGFAPESAFTRQFTRFRTVTLPNYLMMMWLTWWCGWHGGNADHDNR